MTSADCHVIAFPSNGLGTSPWEAPDPLPACTPPSHCDVLVVGAGITGLAAAIAVAGRKREVVVVERAFGGGATARSGGIILGSTLAGPAPLFDRCEWTLRDWIAASATACDLHWEGCLELARDESLSVHPIHWRDNGSIRLVMEIPGGVLHPTKLQTALAAAARAAGAAIVNGVTVQSVEPRPAGIALLTDRGWLAARRLLMAVDAIAWSDAFDPWAQRDITVALQTAPLDRDARDALGLRPHQAFYTCDPPLLWGRMMPDGSLLIGRELLPVPRSRPDAEISDAVAAAGARLLSRVRGLHAGLTDIVAQRTWGGVIATNAAGVPDVIPDPRIAEMVWAGGYGGHGLAQAFRLGTLIGERLVDAGPSTR
jgi:glycine/D-amino acid oxidase-like deaminating enzyme